MDRKKAAKLYGVFLKNAARDVTIEEVLDLYFIEQYPTRDENGREIPVDPALRKKEENAFKFFIQDALDHGQTGNEIINYLNAERDTVDVVNLDKNGEVTSAVRYEGSPLFDPSRKSDLSLLTGSGSPDFEFGDESTGGIEHLNPERLVIGDDPEPSNQGLTMDQLQDLASRAIDPNDPSNYNPDDDEFGSVGGGGLNI
jgi:hypothetical protein